MHRIIETGKHLRIEFHCIELSKLGSTRGLNHIGPNWRDHIIEAGEPQRIEFHWIEDSWLPGEEEDPLAGSTWILLSREANRDHVLRQKRSVRLFAESKGMLRMSQADGIQVTSNVDRVRNVLNRIINTVRSR